MKSINILHLYSDRLSPLYERLLLRSREHLDPERYRLFFATLAAHAVPETRTDADYAVEPLGWMWGKGPAAFLRLVKARSIHCLHTHGASVAVWGALLAKIARLPLAVHSSLAGFPSPCPRWLRGYAAVALPEAAASCTPNAFVNPSGPPDSFFYRPAQPLSHFSVTYETFTSEAFASPPPALTRALQRLREEHPQCTLHLRTARERSEWKEPEPGTFSLHILSTRKATPEALVLRLLECAVQGSALLILGTLPRLPKLYADLVDKFRLQIDLPLRYLEERMKKMFGEPEAAQREVLEIQKILLRHLSFERYIDLWRLQTEDLVEHSTNPKLQGLKTPLVDPLQTPRILSDDEFLNLFQCPRCQRPLTAAVSEQRDGRAWHGQLDCACGQQYPILRGIPRFIDLTGDVPPAPPPTAEQDKPDPFWQRHFVFHRSLPQELTLQSLEPLKRFLSAPMLVLDLKAGRGERLHELIRHGASGIALEESPFIDQSAERFGHSPYLRWVQGSANQPPFKPGSFDLCLHAQAGFDLQDSKARLETWVEVLKPHGSLHLWLQGLSFMNSHDVELLRGACKGLPLGLVMALAYCVAGLQSLSTKVDRLPGGPGGNVHFLASQWFRLLTHPRATLPTVQELRQWVLDVQGNDLRILNLPPTGTCFSFRRG